MAALAPGPACDRRWERSAAKDWANTTVSLKNGVQEKKTRSIASHAATRQALRL